MTIPIYQQTKRDVPCEWVYDDTLDEVDDLPEPSRWDMFLDHFWWIAFGLTIGAIYTFAQAVA